MAQICAHLDQHPTGDGRGSTVTGLDFFQCLTCGRRTGYDGKPYPVPHSSAVYPTMYTVWRAPGVAGNYVSTPDSAALSVTGDIDLKIKLSLEQTSGSPIGIGKSSAGQISFFMEVSTVIVLNISTNGSAVTSQAVSSGITALNTIGWYRVTRVQSTGVVTFLLSSDGIQWTPLGTTQVIEAGTAIWDSTAVVEIGSRNNGGSGSLKGNVYYAEIRNGIDGTLAGYFNPNEVVIGTDNQHPTTLVNGATTWTVNGTAWSWRKAS